MRHDGGARAGTGIHAATIVAPHTWHSAPASLGHYSLLLQARLSRGLAHVSSEYAHVHARSHAHVTCSPTDVWSLRVPCMLPPECTQPRWWRLRWHAGCWLLHNGGPAARCRSAEPNPPCNMLSLPSREVGGSKGVYRNSGLAALLRAGVSAPRWWSS